MAKGGLLAAAGLAILLGADVGSAVVTQLLVVRQPTFIPVLLLVGVALFLRGGGIKAQVDRILIGLALIFVSLDMIRAATGSLVGNPRTQTVMAYLGGDLATAFVLGTGFAWVVHSSVAADLLFVMLPMALETIRGLIQSVTIHETDSSVRINLEGAITALVGLAHPGAEAIINAGSVKVVAGARLRHCFAKMTKVRVAR